MQEKPLKDGEYRSSPDTASLTRPKSLEEHSSLPPSSPLASSSPPHMPSKETFVVNQPIIPRAIGISDAPRDIEDHVPARSGIPTAISRRLYISHSLSTWNSRAFEFGAVLFLASIFPHTLLPLSIYALVRSATAIIVGPLLGHAIDRRNRLQIVRLSIVAGRATVILSCIGFWGLYTYSSISFSGKWVIFSFLTLLACVERSCSTLNRVAIERDWVVVIAINNEQGLQSVRLGSKLTTGTALNARMRRIDLLCKLLSPLCIALIDGASTKVAIFVTIGINLLSLPIEYFAIAQVYKAVPLLRDSKVLLSNPTDIEVAEPISSGSPRIIPPWIRTVYESLKFYYRHPVFLPSFALSLLYLTVLDFQGVLVTYLIAAGYNSFHIALVRTLSVIFELSATWIAPRAMKRIVPARAGMWFLGWHMLWLGAAVSFFWAERVPIIAASGLVAGSILSRIGLWGYDLCAQFIIQEEVQDSHRGSFSSTEASLQSAFELLSYVSTMIWSRPDQFRNPVLLSAVAVYTAGLLFGNFLRIRGIPLMHIPRCMKRKESSQAR